MKLNQERDVMATEAEIEAVAKIIDPVAYEPWPYFGEHVQRSRQARASEKARAALEAAERVRAAVPEKVG